MIGPITSGGSFLTPQEKLQFNSKRPQTAAREENLQIKVDQFVKRTAQDMQNVVEGIAQRNSMPDIKPGEF